MVEVKVIGPDGKEYVVHLRRLKYGERVRILKSVMKVKAGGLDTVNTNVEIDYPALEEMVAVYSIEKIEPNPGMDKRRFLEELEVTEAQKIVNEAMKLNPL